MANIEETEQWDSGIYQLETTDPVQGGADGVDNTPHKNLANRTLWLKNNKADKNGNAAEKFKVANAAAIDEAVNLEQLNTKANLAGSATQKFKVADGTADDEAVSKAQFDSAIQGFLSDGGKLFGVTTGYQKLSNGLIFQWGRTTVNTNIATTVTFAISFPTAGINVLGNLYGDYGAVGEEAVSTYSLNTSSFTLKADSGGSTVTVSWIAIGY